MRTAIWVGLGAILTIGAAIALRRLPPRHGAALLLVLAALGLALLRQFAVALTLAAIGLGLWSRNAPAGPQPAPGRTSAVQTDALGMTLDHDTGRLDGEVRLGRFAGRMLSDLSADELRALVADFEAAGDHDSLSLLLAYLERRGEGTHAPPPDGGAAMGRDEAYRILGLEPGVDVETVREAHRRLMRRVHPDLGGSSALAAMINAARELLDPRPQDGH